MTEKRITMAFSLSCKIKNFEFNSSTLEVQLFGLDDTFHILTNMERADEVPISSTYF